MRRRILVAIVGTVVLSLALSGVGTYLLLRRQAARTAQSTLRSQAEGLSDLVGLSQRSSPGSFRTTRLVRGLRIEGISVVTITPRGIVRGQLPSGLLPQDLDPAQLAAGGSQSGRHGDLLWAAAGSSQGRLTVAVVLTRTAEHPAPPIGWFVLAGAIALAIASAVAWALADEVTRPLRAAQSTTQQLAAGDLSARLQEPAPTEQDELADLTRSINSMAQSLEQSRGMERQFLLSVSHDLRTPLTSISGYAEAIADGTAPDAAAAATVIGSEAARLDRLVQDLLDLARLDARSFSLKPVRLPLGQLLTEVTDGFAPAAAAAGVRLDLPEQSTDAWVYVDPDRLSQALGNVLQNALKHATTSVEVRVIAVSSTMVRVEVTDDGPGVAPEDLPHVFERLYTSGRRAVRGTAGTGLGLALTAEFLHAMGGAAGMESPIGPHGGARVLLQLPVVP